ncbi:MAG TPA: M20/M25/M40 family metallo-hydrolase [Thermoleophilaceae bacterium]|nr:M20/M25/M40 family metallo-hydrolase [Thermoleophilaceae bacterium]
MPDPADLERRTTELLQRLIRFRTVNPPGDEEAAQLYLKDLLEGAGFECELLYATEGRPNLVARLRSGSDGPRLVLLAHVDTVLADPSEWTVDPWGGELRDGCVWGRGALDMKSQLAAEVAAATALAEEGWRPESGELLVVVTCDEETGAKHGAKWLCERHPDKVACDLVVNEGAGEVLEFDGRRVYGVCVAEKGVFRFRLATEGRAGHASLPRIGDNALTKLAPLIERLGSGRASYRMSPEPEALLRALGLDPGDGSDDALAEAVRRVEEVDPRVAILLEPLLSVTLTPTMVHASEKINVIPSRAELAVDCRVPPGLGEDDARAAIAEVLGEDGYSIEFRETVVGNRSPIETDLMENIRAFVSEEDPGAEAAAVALPGFSDSRWFRDAFPDCVAYGFFPQRRMDLFEAAPLVHGADERVPLEDLGLAARFYAQLVEKTLG